jgi:predicted TIM-barrel fold metal-dependent hydrolase
MFGSDYPMWDPGLELEEMRACGLSEGELERVLWRNAVAFTGVEP